MLCSSCGAQCPDDAEFCERCGVVFADIPSATDASGRGRLEFKVITIPLAGYGIKLYDRKGPARIDRIVLKHLQREAEEGWQSAEATDFRSLQLAGRIVWKVDAFDGWGWITPNPKAVSATIRLRRLIEE